MGASFYGELIVRYTADTTSLTNAQRQLATSTAASAKTVQKTWAQSAAKTGLAMQNVGRTFTQYYTLPVAAGLGYAAYSAYKYQKAMIQVKELTGLTAQEASHFSDAIREASAEIGNTGGPQAAAEAYYFLASSGLTAQQAFDALKVSMKANVAGMGDIQVTADVVSSAMNAYRDSNLSAANAMDILMRTIEVGKAEPQALASSLGRIMPIANQLKVSLSELGGNVAALTLGGLSSAESVTALRGAMVALVSPAKMSIERLKTMGLTYQEVTKSIADKGLLPTLKMLWDATDHNMLAMREIIPNVRATTGVMSLLGDSYEHNLEVIAKVNDSQGKLNETYKDAAQTDIAKFNRAMNELKSTFIEVGAVVLPLVTDIVEWLGELVGVFEELSPETQEWTVKILAATAALFPFLSVVGSLTRGIAMLKMAHAAGTIAEIGAAGTTAAGGITSLGTAATVGLGPVLGITAAITGAVLAIGYLANHIEDERFKQTLIPEYQPVIDDKQFQKAMEAGGKWKKVTIEGIVYYDYVVKPKDVTDPETGKTIQSQIQGAAQRGADKLAATKNWFQAEFKKMMAEAAKFGGVNSLAAILGRNVESNLFRGMAVRPRISMLTRQIAELETQMASTSTTLQKSTAAIPESMRNKMEQDLQSYETLLGIKRTQLQGAKALLSASETEMAHLRDIKPRFDASAGRGELRKQLRQYLFDAKAYLSRNREFMFIEPPKIDLKKGGLKSQLSGLKTYLTQLGKSSEVPVEVKIRKTTEVVKDLEGELANVNKRIARSSNAEVTTKLKADKENLENALTVANRKLDSYGTTEKEATLKIAGKDQAILDIQAVRDELKTLTDKTVNITVNAYRRPRAWGGIVTKPELSLVGEAGPEVIIPLTKPARAAQLLAESGLGKFTQAQYKPTQVVYREPAQAAESGPRELHYHNHMSLPQGIVVSDIERFGRSVQPYVERGTLLAQKRRARGKGSL